MEYNILLEKNFTLVGSSAKVVLCSKDFSDLNLLIVRVFIFSSNRFALISACRALFSACCALIMAISDSD